MSIANSMTTLFRNAANRGNGNSHVARSMPEGFEGILSQELFARMLDVERKRCERSGRRFVLMLLESARLLNSASENRAKVLGTLSGISRETDIVGWYKDASILGVIFTELDANLDGRFVGNVLLSRVASALSSVLSASQINEIRLTFRVFPENWDKGSPIEEARTKFPDNSTIKDAPNPLPQLVKRSMDIAGSLLAMIFGLPLFVAVAIAVKVTSRGPVLFLQQRVGRNGRKFKFLKFRSMYVDNDETIHQEYTRSFITNANGCSQTATGQATYKLTADPRVTPLGRFLRRTSLDELPQFLNVLKGEMSLVGPRPPLPYEVEHYRMWHRRRLLAAKPGITGLWQVGGRSRVKFDDMVRMDLRYATSWSVWLDIKILLQTPRAVFFANGAR
jgi:lipopolysaccharide/colanic/teichoic acid biosynthesis glycosyltransferase